MPDSIQAVLDYLIGIQLHPLVTIISFLVIALGRQRWEEVETDPAKAMRVGQWVLLVGWMVSIIGQLTLYWPKDGHNIAICIFMSLGQVGIASFSYSYAKTWGIMDRVGKIVQKKLDDKGGKVPDATPK